VNRSRTAVVCVLALLAAPARANEPLTRREKGDLAIRARAILKKHCAECHGADEARGTVRVLDHGRLVATGPNPVPFVAPERAAASQVVQFLEDGSMPPGDRDRPTPDEVRTVKEWIAAAAPSYPAAFDDRTTLRTILDDVRHHPEDAPHLRYLSLAHLVRDGAELPDLKKAEFDLQKALAWCGVKPPAGKAAAEPVDGTATLFRLDARHAGWDARDLFTRSPKGGSNDLFRLTPYDLVLLEYPFAAALPPGDALAGPLGEYLSAAGLARPVPFLRADWLAEKLAAKAPLADDLRALGVLATALAKQNWPDPSAQKDMPCGPAARAFAGANPVPPSPKAGGARAVPALSAWYAGDCQAETAPFSLAFDAVDTERNVLKEMAKGTPFRLKVKTDRKIHYVLLNVFSTRDVEVLPTREGGFLEPGEHFLTPPREIAFRITDILTNEPKANEYFVLLASPDPIPTPVVVRSRHASGHPDCEADHRYPIYRFVFAPDAKFDPSRVVRRVVAVTVTDK
jgi:mono/diheme cytochrome c family protein